MKSNERGTPEYIGAFTSGLFMVGGMWFIAIFIWSFALDAWRLPLLIFGLVVGGSLGVITGQAAAKSPDLMSGATALLMPPAMVIFALGLAIWGARSIF